MSGEGTHRWSTKQPGIRFVLLMPAMFGGLFPVLLRWLRHDPHPNLLTAVTALIVPGIAAYGLLAWKIVIEAHRQSGVGGLFGEEK